MRNKFTMTRDFFVPKGATKIADKLSDAVAYLSVNSRGKPRATMFVGKQAKPLADYWFTTEDRRAERVKEFFENRRASQARKVERAKERKAFTHKVKVGDMFYTNWGYDQTNTEYFQVVEIKGKRAVLREIGCESVDTGYMTGQSAPLKDSFLSPRYDGDDRGLPIRRLIQDGHIKIDDVRRAWPVKTTTVAGIEIADSNRWSSYA